MSFRGSTLKFLTASILVFRAAMSPRVLLSATFGFSILAAVFQMLSLALVIPVLNGFVDKERYEALLRVYRPYVEPVQRFIPFELTNASIFISLVSLVLLCIYMENLLLYLGQAFSARLVTTTAHNLRIRAFERYLTLGKSFFDRKSIGDAHVVFTKLISEVGQHFHHLATLFVHVCFSSAFLLLMLCISWRLTLLAMILIPIVQLISIVLTKRLKQAAASEVDSTIAFSSRSLDVLRNIELCILSGREKEELQELEKVSSNILHQGFSCRARRASLPRLIDSLNSTAIILLACGATFLFFKVEASSIGRLSVFFISLRRFGTQMEHLIGAWAQCISNLPLLERTIELFSEGEESKVRGGSFTFSGIQEGIEFRNVSFGYLTGAPVLNDISFRAERSTMTALIGATGAGKTTLVNLLARFYEYDAGDILIDGRSIREFDLVSLRQKIGFVSQQAQLFSTSIRENIAYGTENASDEAIYEAARSANILERILELPSQFEEPVGANGIQLSGGERQRISIARALLRNPEILILDEATSALDAETEELVHQAIEKLIENRTVFVIAHRLATIRKADQILVLERGRIVERGTAASLLREGGRFHKYYTLQNLGVGVALQ